MAGIFTIIAVILFCCGLLSAGITSLAWKRRKIMNGFLFLLVSLLLSVSALVFLLLAAGVTGYKALVHEELAATVRITPLGGQRFTASVTRPDGRDTAFTLAGDELYVDARVLKWRPFVNLFGLHTAYRLDRVGGRYLSLKDEKARGRTLYSLDGEMMPWDLFFLRTKFAFLAPLVDAQYGSAAFTAAKGAATVRIMVTTSGLIARTD